MCLTDFIKSVRLCRIRYMCVKYVLLITYIIYLITTSGYITTVNTFPIVKCTVMCITTTQQRKVYVNV